MKEKLFKGEGEGAGGESKHTLCVLFFLGFFPLLYLTLVCVFVVSCPSGVARVTSSPSGGQQGKR